MRNNNSAANQSTNSNTQKQYFNSTTKGLAFLNKISFKNETGRDEQVKVSLAALVGPEDAVQYERYTLYVYGEQALTAIKSLEHFLEDEDNKVTVSFTASNCRARGFIPDEGKHEGKLMTYQEGKLIFISSARVNGEEVFRAPERQE